jgi:hypothetical protein
MSFSSRAWQSRHPASSTGMSPAALCDIPKQLVQRASALPILHRDAGIGQPTLDHGGSVAGG